MTILATDAFRTIGPGDALPNDFVVPYYLADRKRRISIARVADRLYAFDDLCRCTDHGGCPLSGGLLTATTIMCQCHGSRFDISTGAVINGPATRPLNLYEVYEVGAQFSSESDGRAVWQPPRHRSDRVRRIVSSNRRRVRGRYARSTAIRSAAPARD
jgi:3-phenylpropionate/trans-cinnamate dioxygenase ferredoxin component